MTTYNTLIKEHDKNKEDIVEINEQLADIVMIINAKQNTDITTELQQKLNLINSLGKRGTIKAKGSFLLNGTITIPSNITIDFTEATLTSNLSSSNLPVEFFKISGNDITIKAKLSLNMSQLDVSTRGRAITFDSAINTFNNITIENCDLRNVCYCVNATNQTINNLRIVNNTFVGVLRDIYLNRIFGNNTIIDDNYFPVDRNWTTPYTYWNAIMITGGFDNAFGSGTPEFTNDIYETKFYDNIRITNNTFVNPTKRVIFISNAKHINVDNNKIFAKIGAYTDINCTHDVIALEYCRYFSCNNNKITASGENGIDLLACKHGSVIGNELENIYTNGIEINVSDRYLEGKSPNLNKIYEVTEFINIDSNGIHGAEADILIGVGQNISFNGNRLNQYAIERSNYHVAFLPRTAFIGTDQSLFFKNIKFSDTLTNVPQAKVYHNSIDYSIWGTIELGRALAYESNWISVNANDTYLWSHGRGFYNNVEIYFQLDPTLIANWGVVEGRQSEAFRIRGTYTNPVTQKIHGTIPVWNDKYQTYVKVGDYLIDVPNRTEGAGRNMGLITTGKIKIVLY